MHESREEIPTKPFLGPWIFKMCWEELHPRPPPNVSVLQGLETALLLKLPLPCPRLEAAKVFPSRWARPETLA